MTHPPFCVRRLCFITPRTISRWQIFSAPPTPPPSRKLAVASQSFAYSRNNTRFIIRSIILIVPIIDNSDLDFGGNSNSSEWVFFSCGTSTRAKAVRYCFFTTMSWLRKHGGPADKQASTCPLTRKYQTGLLLSFERLLRQNSDISGLMPGHDVLCSWELQPINNGRMSSITLGILVSREPTAGNIGTSPGAKAGWRCVVELIVGEGAKI